MRLNLRRNLCLAYEIAYAQKQHYLQTNICLSSNSLTKNTTLCLLNSGLVLHYWPKQSSSIKKLPKGAIFCFVLRYWEGQPLISIGASPKLNCSYKTLKRRFKHGSGVTFLIWAGGKLLTSNECLDRRIGGYLCATLVS